MFSRASILLSALVSFSYLLTSVGHGEFLSSASPQISVSELTNVLPAADPLASDASMQQLAQKAYVWGWPLVYVHNCRVALERVPAPGRSGGMPVAPHNELSMLTDYIAPKINTVPCPNQDVVYGFGILDLDIEPVVLQVPDFGDRFWLYQLGDARTDSFAGLGKVYGTKPGMYLIAGPKFDGTVPAGIAGVLRCPTRIGYVLPRVFLDDSAADRSAVQPLINQISMYPLSRFAGSMKTRDWTKSRWLPNVKSGERAKRVVPEKFFDDLAVVLGDVPPLAGEEGLYADLRALLAKAAADSDVKSLLVQTAVAAESEVMAPLFEFHNVGNQLPHNWTTIANGAAFGTDYRTRAAVAKSNVFVNRSNETKYYYQDMDDAGRRLDGGKSYSITFAPGELPPAAGFWSLTLYDENHTFHANDLGRYSLGTKNRNLKFNNDGSLTILVQSSPPSADELANWLPAPQGKFSLYLRAYAPSEAAIAGAWVPPPVLLAAN